MPTSLSTISESSRLRGPRSSLCGRAITLLSLTSERQAGFAHRIRERFDATVIKITAAVEHHLRDARLLSALGDQLADFDRRRLVSALLQPVPQVLVDRGGRGQGYALGIVDDLGVDVLAGAEHRQARPAVGPAAQAVAHPKGTSPLLFPMAKHYFFLPSLRMISSSA